MYIYAKLNVIEIVRIVHRVLIEKKSLILRENNQFPQNSNFKNVNEKNLNCFNLSNAMS